MQAIDKQIARNKTTKRQPNHVVQLVFEVNARNAEESIFILKIKSSHNKIQNYQEH